MLCLRNQIGQKKKKHPVHLTSPEKFYQKNEQLSSALPQITENKPFYNMKRNTNQLKSRQDKQRLHISQTVEDKTPVNLSDIVQGPSASHAFYNLPQCQTPESRISQVSVGDEDAVGTQVLPGKQDFQNFLHT